MIDDFFTSKLLAQSTTLVGTLGGNCSELAKQFTDKKQIRKSILQSYDNKSGNTLLSNLVKK